MTAAWICGRRIEAGFVGLAGADGFVEGVVDLEDGFLRAVDASVLGFVFALHDREAVQDIGDGGVGCGERLGQGVRLLTPLGLRAEVEVEEGGVQLAAEQEAGSSSQRNGGPDQPQSCANASKSHAV